ncbi:MAG: type II secretion system F family protein, partial [Pararhodobacter sp.]
MTAFDFRAADIRGRTRKGVIDASGPSEAREKLRARNLLPLDVTPAGRSAAERGSPPQEGFLKLPGRNPLTGRDLALVCRQMATLTRNHVRIEDALSVIARQMRTRRPVGVLMSVRAAVMEGRSFASALSDFPGAFP